MRWVNVSSNFCSLERGGLKSNFWFYAGDWVEGLWKQKAFPSLLSRIPTHLHLEKLCWIISTAIWYWISQTVVYLDERFTGDFEILQKTYLLKQFISGGNFIFPDDFIFHHFTVYGSSIIFLRKWRFEFWTIPVFSRKWLIISLWF